MTDKPTNQFDLIKLAISFYSRLPVPLKDIDFDCPEAKVRYEHDLTKISRYFGLVGIIIGLLCGLGYYLSSLLLPNSIAVIFTIIIGLLLTGGLHEDGLADICDGFGGGWTIERKLEIMKDSSIGVYGTLALICALLLKFSLLLELSHIASVANIVFSLIIAHTLSRIVSYSISFSLPYARKLDSKVGQIVKNPNSTDIKWLAITALSVLLLTNFQLAIVLIITLLISRQWLIYLFNKQIQGYTGDCLGAAQQISELICYASILIYFT